MIVIHHYHFYIWFYCLATTKKNISLNPLPCFNHHCLSFTLSDYPALRENPFYSGSLSRPNSKGECMDKNNFEPLWDRKTTANYMNVSPGTLAVWDCTKRFDLQPIKVGRCVRYRPSVIRKFLEDRTSPS
jgi:hypothetical protein